AVERSKANLTQAQAEKDAAAAQTAKAEADLKAAQAAAAAAEKPLRAVAFSADGKTLATAGDDNLVHLWDAETGAPLETLAGHQAVVNTLAPAGGNLLLSAAADKQAVVWHINPDWQLVGQLAPQKDAPPDLTASPFADRVTALAFSPDGKLLAAGGGEPSRSGELMIWDVAARSLVRKIEDPHSDTVFSVEF